jgi:octaprenyl-diphosphate synthase
MSTLVAEPASQSAALQAPNLKDTALKDAALQAIYAPIATEMAEVEALFRREMHHPHPYVDELVRYGCLLGGKRLRPALLLLTAKAAGKVTREHLILATVVEMVHTATLVHDDVLDNAQMRRHLATVNARWDNEASVLLGDYLFTHAFHLASTIDNVLGCRLIGQATNIVCEGELRQKGTRGQFDLGEEEYLQVIEAKTAELTACSCRLGALFAGLPAATAKPAAQNIVEELDRYGRELGIAFQIADDLLDVTGEEDATGKSLGTDLAKQKPTLPLIHTLREATPADRQELLELLTSEQATPALLQPYLSRYGGLDYARTRAQAFATSARKRLHCLAPSPAKDVLLSLGDFVVARSH